MSPTSTTSSTSIPKDKHVLVRDGQVVNKGEMIVDGAVDPHDLLRSAGWALGLLVGINLITSGWAIVMAAVAGRSVAQAVAAPAAEARH